MHAGTITWGDISHSLQAIGHIPRRAFAQALNIMEEAWSEENSRLAKLSGTR